MLVNPYDSDSVNDEKVVNVFWNGLEHTKFQLKNKVIIVHDLNDSGIIFGTLEEADPFPES